MQIGGNQQGNLSIPQSMTGIMNQQQGNSLIQHSMQGVGNQNGAHLQMNNQGAQQDLIQAMTQSNQGGIIQPDTNQQSLSGMFFSQYSNNSLHPSSQSSKMNEALRQQQQQQQRPQTDQQNNMNFTLQQSMLQAISMQNSMRAMTNQGVSQQQPSGHGQNQMMSQNQQNQGLALMTNRGSSADQFTPFAVSSAPMFPNAQNPAPVNQRSSLLDTAPQEFAGFEIPEPDPLPDSSLGMPRQFPPHRGQFQ